jgi:hypothetical protein
MANDAPQGGWDYTPVEFNPFDTPFASDEDVARNRELLLSKGTAGGDAMVERVKGIPDRFKQMIMDYGRLLAIPGDVAMGNYPYTGDNIMFSPELLSDAGLLAEELAGGGLLVPRPRGSLGMFGNELALGADLDKRNAAKLILDAGGTNADAQAQTGWFKAADGDLKFEFSDVGSKFDVPLLRSMKEGDWTELQTLLTHPELYANYPHLRYAQVFPDNVSGALGSYYPGENKVSLVNDMTLYSPWVYNPHSTTLHEVAHAIADFTGSKAKGANSKMPEATQAGNQAIANYTKQIDELEAKLEPDIKSYSNWLRDLPKPTWRELLQKQQQGDPNAFKDAFAKEVVVSNGAEIQKQIAELKSRKVEALMLGRARAGYLREAGEVEARNVQTRWENKITNKAPWETQEFPFEEQFIFQNGVAIPVGKIK